MEAGARSHSLQLVVHGLNSDKIELEVESDKPLSHVTAELATRLGIDDDEFDEVHLFKGGTELIYDTSPRLNNLESGDVLHMVRCKSVNKAIAAFQTLLPIGKAPPPRPPPGLPDRVMELRPYDEPTPPGFEQIGQCVKILDVLSAWGSATEWQETMDRMRQKDLVWQCCVLTQLCEVDNWLTNVQTIISIQHTLTDHAEELARMMHRNPVRIAAGIATLAITGDVQMIDRERALVWWASDSVFPVVRVASLTAIASLYGTKYVHQLEDIARLDPDRSVRDVCATLLGRMNALRHPSPMSPPPARAAAMVKAAAKPAAVEPNRPAQAILPQAPPPLSLQTCSKAAPTLAPLALSPFAMPPPAAPASSGGSSSATSSSAALEEQAGLMRAIMLSLADIPEHLSEDGVVLYKLDRRAGSAEVVAALSSSPALEAPRRTVLEAQCDLQPAWAGGAWVFFPMSREVFEEAGLPTSNNHIFMLGRDEHAVRQALRLVPKAKRPLLQRVCAAGRAVTRDGVNADALPSDGASGELKPALIPECVIVVERTFFELRVPKTGGSACLLSAPARLEQASNDSSSVRE